VFICLQRYTSEFNLLKLLKYRKTIFSKKEVAKYILNKFIKTYTTVTKVKYRSLPFFINSVDIYVCPFKYQDICMPIAIVFKFVTRAATLQNEKQQSRPLHLRFAVSEKRHQISSSYARTWRLSDDVTNAMLVISEM